MKKICKLSLERNLNPVCRVREKLHCKIVFRKEKKEAPPKRKRNLTKRKVH